MTRDQLLTLMTYEDLLKHGYGPPAPGSFDYDARLARFQERVAIARRDATTTLAAIEAAEGAAE